MVAKLGKNVASLYENIRRYYTKISYFYVKLRKYTTYGGSLTVCRRATQWLTYKPSNPELTFTFQIATSLCISSRITNDTLFARWEKYRWPFQHWLARGDFAAYSWPSRRPTRSLRSLEFMRTLVRELLTVFYYCLLYTWQCKWIILSSYPPCFGKVGFRKVGQILGNGSIRLIELYLYRTNAKMISFYTFSTTATARWISTQSIPQVLITWPEGMAPTRMCRPTPVATTLETT